MLQGRIMAAPGSPKDPQVLKIERLRKRAQFLFVRHGLKYVRPSVIVEARRRAPEGVVGVGFTASRKVGGAVVRNRARRRMKEAALRLMPLHALAGVDYVLVARPRTPEASWAGLLDDLGNALIWLRAELDKDQGGDARGARRRPRRGNKPGGSSPVRPSPSATTDSAAPPGAPDEGD